MDVNLVFAGKTGDVQGTDKRNQRFLQREMGTDEVIENDVI